MNQTDKNSIIKILDNLKKEFFSLRFTAVENNGNILLYMDKDANQFSFNIIIIELRRSSLVYGIYITYSIEEIIWQGEV